VGGLYSSARIFWKECALSGNKVVTKWQKGAIFLRLLFSIWQFAWDNQCMRSAEFGMRNGANETDAGECRSGSGIHEILEKDEKKATDGLWNANSR